MAENSGPKVERNVFTVDSLQKTTPLVHQEFCAYTYLLLPEPTNNVYGVLKVICTGNSVEACENIIKEKIEKGDLEAQLPFISVVPTGRYRYIHPGGDPHNVKDVYNTVTKEVVHTERDKFVEKRKQRAQEMEKREEEIRQDAQAKLEKDPESYETYAHLTVKENGINAYIKEQQRLIDKQKKVLVETTKKRQTLDRKFPKYKRQFAAEVKKDIEQMKKEQEGETVEEMKPVEQKSDNVTEKSDATDPDDKGKEDAK